jgi:hypothetical protein
MGNGSPRGREFMVRGEREKLLAMAIIAIYPFLMV